MGLSGQNQKNRSVWIFKLEGRNLLPKNVVPLPDSKYNVYCDFATKHVPIQSDDQVMDICGMPKSR